MFETLCGRRGLWQDIFQVGTPNVNLVYCKIDCCCQSKSEKTHWAFALTSLQVETLRRAMAALPVLPHRSYGLQWSPHVRNAYRIASDLFRNACQAMQHEDAEVQRLSFHIDSLVNDCVALLEALEEQADLEGVPIPWLHSCAQAV